MSAKSQILRLYKSMLRESQKFPSYNFRNYAIRKIRDSFRNNKRLTENGEIAKEISIGKENLEIIKRQVIISKMYSTDKLVIENLA